MQTAGARVGVYQSFEFRLVNWHHSRLKLRDFFGVIIDTHNLMAQLSKASATDESYIPGAHNRQLHDKRS